MPWRQPAFFFPTGNTLGYSDTFVLDELFYAPLRWASLDPFAAFQGTVLAGSLVGFTGAHCLCRRILGGHVLTSSLLALTFTFSNALFVQAGHSQLYAIYWCPGVIVLVLRSTDARNGRLLNAFGAGLLTGTLFLSTYYLAWFFAVCSALWCLFYWLLRGNFRRTWSTLRTAIAAYRTRMAVCAVGLAIPLVPFGIVYLPALKSGRRPVSAAVQNAAGVGDMINTGQRNLLWGPLTRTVLAPGRLRNGELGFGLTPVTLMLVAVSTAYFVHRLRVSGSSRPRDRAALATGLVAVVSIVLPMRILGVVPWTLIWHLVPGASAIRAIDRLALMSSLLGMMVIAFAVAEIVVRPKDLGATAPATGGPVARPAGRPRGHLMAATVVLLGICAVEQVNVGRNAGIDRRAEMAALAAVPEPPTGCRAFYVTVSAGDVRRPDLPSIDAMLVAQKTGLPTVNGFSGLFPPGYGAVSDPASPRYGHDVRQWVVSHGVTAGMCGYNLASRTWTSGT